MLHCIEAGGGEGEGGGGWVGEASDSRMEEVVPASEDVTLIRHAGYCRWSGGTARLQVGPRVKGGRGLAVVFILFIYLRV